MKNLWDRLTKPRYMIENEYMTRVFLFSVGTIMLLITPAMFYLGLQDSPTFGIYATYVSAALAIISFALLFLATEKIWKYVRYLLPLFFFLPIIYEMINFGFTMGASMGYSLSMLFATVLLNKREQYITFFILISSMIIIVLWRGSPYSNDIEDIPRNIFYLAFQTATIRFLSGQHRKAIQKEKSYTAELSRSIKLIQEAETSLKKKVDELETMNKHLVARELRMVKLKEEMREKEKEKQ